MPSFEFAMMNAYYNEHLKQFDRLAEAASLIDWEAFRPIIASFYQNLTERGGRPNIDPIVMLKLLVLQQWYGLSDPELERQTARDLIFQHFLGFPGTVPDFTTVWLFRERLIRNGKYEKVWSELQRQMSRSGFKVEKKGKAAQDATFITADPGHAPMEPRGIQALTRRSRDGAWTKKLNRSYFGFKPHVKTDLKYGLIRAFETTTASVHDSQVDLSRRGEVVYRDKGYFGVPSKGYNATMQRGTRAGSIGIFDRMRNARISRKRAPIERTFAVLKSGHVLVTTVPRARVKMLFSCLCFNLMQMLTPRKQALA